MLIEGETFDDDNAPPSPIEWGDTVFRHCTFEEIDLEGVIFGGIMEGCTFSNSEFYWGLFNVALVAGVRFEECRFRSSSFRGSTFVDCTFKECTFELDNLGSDCTIDDCLMAACAFESCTWTIKQGGDRRDVTRTRWLGCTQRECTGFDGMF